MRASPSGAIVHSEAIPLRVSRERFWLYGCALVLAGCSVIIGGVNSGFGDWAGYVQAGRDVGTTRLLQPPPGMLPFLYLPAFAWLFAPLRGLPLALSYAANGIAMAACAAGAGIVLGRVYGVGKAAAVLLVFAWNPTLYSIAIGQTSSLGLLLAALCTYGLTRASIALTAVPAALLLFKPTYALPLLLLMLVRGRVRALALCAAIGGALYLPSMWAAANDPLWPKQWIAALRGWFPTDNWHSAPKAISTTTLLVHAHLPAIVIALFAAIIVAAALPLLVRLPIAEAAALALALGVVVSAHALTYEGVMLVPLLFVIATRFAEPWRTPSIAAAYAIAAFAPYADVIGLNTLAVLTPVLAIGWLAWSYRSAFARQRARPS